MVMAGGAISLRHLRTLRRFYNSDGTKDVRPRGEARIPWNPEMAWGVARILRILKNLKQPKHLRSLRTLAWGPGYDS